MRRIPGTDLDVFPLCLGGNVLGWTADEAMSRAVLDKYIEQGGNFIDTADMYAGGRSEEIIGDWLDERRNRDFIVLATKVGMSAAFEGLRAGTIRAAAEASLERLQTDWIDLYYAHRDDPDTPLEETLGAFDDLVKDGLVRYIAASNYTAPRLAAALAVSERKGLAKFVGLQPHYNLVERDSYEGELEDLCAKRGIGCMPYFGLARGFLTGKYRPDGPRIESARASGALAYLDDRGIAVLDALDEIAGAHRTTQAAVALAWLAAQPTVVAPIASARTPEQLADLLPMASIELSADELARLDAASA
ncbi:MAG TPA: aldo/keto reductase [Solirubrobacteraceae bacterium]|jgi:aryl-alcohol dehydrogenase (NADP+)|nr:aldo/keto reductase [Solirubrobacteraceae bacterium]